MIKLNKVKQLLVIIAILSAIGASIFLFKKFDFVYTLYPTKSSPYKLSLVLYSGFHNNQPVITLRHYIEEQHVCDYILSIENGLGIQEPQKYNLPAITEGTVEVIVYLGAEESSDFSITYPAEKLYKDGLLIYLTTNGSVRIVTDGKEYYDRFVYFVSGKQMRSFFKQSHTEEWIQMAGLPALKKIPEIYNDGGPFLPWDSGWEENEWVILEAK